MPVTYAQLTDFVLTEAAKEGRKQFNFIWLRQQIHAQARRVKRRLGPRLNKLILRTLDHEAQLGYIHLQQGPRIHDLSINMSAGGHHAYLTRSTPVTIEAKMTSAPKTRSGVSDVSFQWYTLLQENEELKGELLKMEIHLARANSLIDIENGGNAGVVTGLPASITERIQRLVVLSKNRKDQIQQMHEDEQYRLNAELLNTYYERDMEERAARDSLFQEYRDWDAEERGIQDPGRDDREEGQATPSD
ncbi:hypothetical protein H4582DRAFT_2175237 [Lactarius indigo]|nr:hypothetical protein H4582DRAFT_2175237 [Lactarius indigo]